MTSQTSRGMGWRRSATAAVASAALAVGLMAGPGIAFAWADPTTEETPAQPEMTVEQVLNIIATEYDTGSGGGQLSNLVHRVLKLRSQGYRASQANRDAIVAALDKRPNQAPLIAALQGTLGNMLKQQARAQSEPVPTTSTTIGMGQGSGNQYDPNGNRNQDAGGVEITVPQG